MERWLAPSKTRLPLQRLLQGNWRLARRITSLHDGAELGAVILGTASFLPVAEAPLDLLYREAGQVQLPGKATALRFERSYLYTFESERSATVRFYESKPSGGEHLKLFHSLAFGDDGRARASHRCVEDLYEVEFDFCSESELASRWVVRGPEKAYEIASTLSRDGPTPSDQSGANLRTSQSCSVGWPTGNDGMKSAQWAVREKAATFPLGTLQLCEPANFTDQPFQPHSLCSLRAATWTDHHSRRTAARSGRPPNTRPPPSRSQPPSPLQTLCCRS